MDRSPVKSSNIRSIGYDAGSSVLEIEFNTGDVYQYSGVPVAHHQGIMKAESHGKYLNAHIKGRFSFRQVK